MEDFENIFGNVIDEAKQLYGVEFVEELDELTEKCMEEAILLMNVLAEFHIMMVNISDPSFTKILIIQSLTTAFIAGVIREKYPFLYQELLDQSK